MLDIFSQWAEISRPRVTVKSLGDSTYSRVIQGVTMDVSKLGSTEQIWFNEASFDNKPKSYLML